MPDHDFSRRHIPNRQAPGRFIHDAGLGGFGDARGRDSMLSVEIIGGFLAEEVQNDFLERFPEIRTRDMCSPRS